MIIKNTVNSLSKALILNFIQNYVYLAIKNYIFKY